MNTTTAIPRPTIAQCLDKIDALDALCCTMSARLAAIEEKKSPSAKDMRGVADLFVGMLKKCGLTLCEDCHAVLSPDDIWKLSLPVPGTTTVRIDPLCDQCVISRANRAADFAKGEDPYFQTIYQCALRKISSRILDGAAKGETFQRLPGLLPLVDSMRELQVARSERGAA